MHSKNKNCYVDKGLYIPFSWPKNSVERFNIIVGPNWSSGTDPLDRIAIAANVLMTSCPCQIKH